MSYRPTLDERLRAEAQQMAKDFGEDWFGQEAFYNALCFVAALALREAATDYAAYVCAANGRLEIHSRLERMMPHEWLRVRADEIEKGGA